MLNFIQKREAKARMAQNGRQPKLQKDYSQLKKSELIDLLSQKGIPTDGLTKAELLEILEGG